MALGSLRDFQGKSARDLFADVVDRGLCTACGTCAAVCARDCLVLDGEEVSPGDALRARAVERCNSCGICYACCPGERVAMPELEQRLFGKAKDVRRQLLGLYRHRCLSQAADEAIRTGGASGGTATALQLYALEKGLIDGVLGVGYRADKPWVPTAVFSRTPEEILATQGSKYTHCSVNDALRELAEKKPRVAVVGLGCHITGLRKIQAYMGRSRLARSVVFTIGLFCAGNRFTRGAAHIIARRMGVPLEKVARLSYREGAYPGAMTVWDTDGGVHKIPYPDQLTYIWMHVRPRCAICFDYSAELADICLGDTHIKEFSKIPHNAALVRTEIGAEIFDGAVRDGYITTWPAEERDMMRITGFERKKFANLMRLEWYRQHGLPTPDYPDPSVRYDDLEPVFFGAER